MKDGSYKWNVTIDGHAALLSLKVNGNYLTGTVESAEYGRATIVEGGVIGQTLTGSVELHGTMARITVTVAEDGSLSGEVRVGWFISVALTGIVTA